MYVSELIILIQILNYLKNSFWMLVSLIIGPTKDAHGGSTLAQHRMFDMTSVGHLPTLSDL